MSLESSDEFSDENKRSSDIENDDDITRLHESGTLNDSNGTNKTRNLTKFIENNFIKLLNNKELSDVSFKVGRYESEYKIFYGIRSIFAIHSPIFKNLLYGSMFESINKNLDNYIIINDLEPNIFEYLQKLFYGINIKNCINIDNVAGLLYASEKYFLKELKEECIFFINININNINNILTILCNLMIYGLSNHDIYKNIIDNIKINNFEICYKIIKNKNVLKFNRILLENFIFKSNKFNKYINVNDLWFLLIQWSKYQNNISNNINYNINNNDSNDDILTDDDMTSDDIKRDINNEATNEIINDNNYDNIKPFLKYFDFNKMSINFFTKYVEKLNIIDSKEIMKVYVYHLNKMQNLLTKNGINYNNDNNNNNNIPKYINLSFNVYNNKYINVSEYGKVIKTIYNMGQCIQPLLCFDNNAINSGINIWKIKLVNTASKKSHVYQSIGICSLFTQNDTRGKWPYNDLGYSYIFCSEYNSIRVGFNGKSKNIKSIDKFIKNDIIKIILNCIDWKLIFYKNDIKIAKLNIKPNIKYYPFIGCCDCTGYHFKVL